MADNTTPSSKQNDLNVPSQRSSRAPAEGAPPEEAPDYDSPVADEGNDASKAPALERSPREPAEGRA